MFQYLSKNNIIPQTTPTSIGFRCPLPFFPSPALTVTSGVAHLLRLAVFYGAKRGTLLILSVGWAFASTGIKLWQLKIYLMPKRWSAPSSK